MTTCPQCDKNEPHACTDGIVTELQRGADISLCGHYRYALYRTIPGANVARTLAVIGHNPSTADGNEDDATIRRVMGFARRFDYGFLVMLNLFAYRATDSDAVPRDGTAIGEDNDWHLSLWFGLADKVIAAWGAIEHPLKEQAIRVVRLNMPPEKKLFCLGVTKNNDPRHPLYMPSEVTPVPWFGTCCKQPMLQQLGTQGDRAWCMACRTHWWRNMQFTERQWHEYANRPLRGDTDKRSLT